MTAATDKKREADLRWLKKAEHWGAWIRYPDDRPGSPERVWMMRGGNGRVRFYAEGKGQVGPEHASVMAAAYWAWSERWLWTDPEDNCTVDMGAQLACRAWVLDGGAREHEVAPR